MIRRDPIIVRMLALIALGALVGCEAQERRKFDAWFPPGSSRQQIHQQYGEPLWTLLRPGENPTPREWADASLKFGPWLHPGWFAQAVADAEGRAHQRVARLDSFSPPSHVSWNERLDWLWGGHLDVVFYDERDVVISSEL